MLVQNYGWPTEYGFGWPDGRLGGPGPPGSMTPALEISQPPLPPPQNFLNPPPPRKFLSPPLKISQHPSLPKISQPNSNKSQSQKIC